MDDRISGSRADLDNQGSHSPEVPRRIKLKTRCHGHGSFLARHVDDKALIVLVPGPLHLGTEPALAPDERDRSALEGRNLALHGKNYFLVRSPPDAASLESAAMKASCGTSTRPTIFIRFLPSFCFSSSLRLREMSPP